MQKSFRFPFPLCITRLNLAVIDSSCDEAEAAATVTGSVQSGRYCYFYDSSDLVPICDALLEEPHPEYAFVSKAALFTFLKKSYLQ